MKIEGESQMKFDGGATLETLEKALKAWDATAISIPEIWRAIGGVVPHRMPTKAEVLRTLEDMCRQVDGPSGRAPAGMFVIANELELLLSVFPTEEYHLRNYEVWVRTAIRKLRDRIESHRSAPRWDGKAVAGNVLPPVGYLVSIHLGRSETWVNHTVTGHAVHVLDNGKLLALVNVIDDKGFPNQRNWSEVRPPVE